MNSDELISFKDTFKSNFSETLPLAIDIGENGKPEFRLAIQGRAPGKLASRATDIAGFVSERLSFDYIEAVRTAEHASIEVSRMVSSALRDAAMQFLEDKVEEIVEQQRKELEPLSEKLTSTLQRFLPNVTSVSIVPKSDQVRLIASAVDIYILMMV